MTSWFLFDRLAGQTTVVPQPELRALETRSVPFFRQLWLVLGVKLMEII